MFKIRPFLRHAALFLGLANVTPVAVEAQSRVDNIATLSFDGVDGRVSVRSNLVSFDVEKRAKVPTRLSFHLVPVGYELHGQKCETTPSFNYTPAPVDAIDLARAPEMEALDTSVPLILELDNAGANHDPTQRETSWIQVDSGQFHLTIKVMETGPNTGVFAGGIPASSPESPNAACDPRFKRGALITLKFVEDDYSYGSTTAELVDPAGYVFDSQTGALIDGATVSLLDANGNPAQVFGDDGISAYPSTVISGAETHDASGRVYDFAQGHYRFPLVAPGTYHLKITAPANYSAPSTRSRDALTALRDPTNQPFVINDSSFGGTFTIGAIDPFFTDIPMDRQGETKLLVTKTASVREASPGDFIQYRVHMENRGDGSVSGIHLTDILPTGLRYERGSARGVAAQPEISSDGRTLDFPLTAVGAGQSVDVTYVVSVAPGAPAGEAINRVLASGSAGATSNEAAAAVRLRPALFTDGFTVIGRVTEGDCRDPLSKRIGIAGIRLMLEDGTFVVTDKDGLYHFEGVRPGPHVVQLDAGSVLTTHEPVLCDADTRQAGSAVSRFVESAGGLLQRVDFQLRPTHRAAVEVAATLPAIRTAADAAGDRDWFAGQAPGVAMLFPSVDHNPRAPALRVVIKHLPGQRVALRVNGQAADPLTFDTTDTRGDIAISRWTGLPLIEGANTLEARVLNANGGVATTLTRTITSSSIPAQAVFVPEASRLAADGLTRPLIAVRLTGRDGRPVRDGTTVPVEIGAPYTAAVDTQTGAAPRVARVHGDEGLAYVQLQPTTQAGAAHVALTLADTKSSRVVDLQAWLIAAQHDWTVVGFGKGTIGFQTLSRHASGLPVSEQNKVVTDGQLAFYAKGRIKGSWLLTIAYDSDRQLDRSRGLLGTIDPDRYYTVYGDRTQQGYDAATSRKLYLRLERRDFQALFGDFETGLTETRLGRYSRTLNGLKAQYRGKRTGFTAFAANSEERFARDEIQGNGLSGPYRLSGRDIVPNSDKLRIQIRDRLRPEQIVSSTEMVRHIDYDIDSDAGTIRFRAPVLGRDIANNPVFIVVDYETYGRGRQLVAGGRAAATMADGKIEVGVSAIRDETAGKATVAAVDLTVKPSATTELHIEGGAGGHFGLGKGRAFLGEIQHHSATVDALLYARQQDAQFGVGQQNIVDAGTSKQGFDTRVKLTDRITLAAAAWHQTQLVGPGERVAGEARVELARKSGTIFAGGQFAADTGIDGQDRKSSLLTLGGTQALLGGKLTLTAQTQIAPGGQKDSVDFPARQQISASYRLSPGVRVIGGYEVAQGKDYTTHTAQVGFEVAPWTGAKLSTTINQQAIDSENGARTFAQYGLNQSLSLGKRWTVDGTLDASTTVHGTIPAGGVIAPFQTTASGSTGATGLYGNDGDYVAATVGAGYRAGPWSANGRLEWRKSDESRRIGLTANVLRQLGEGQTLASSIKYFTLTQKDGSTAKSMAADVALALRPLDSRWSLLERFQLRHEQADGAISANNTLGVPTTANGTATTRAINNAALNYRTGAEGEGHGFEATIYSGTKWVQGSYGDDDYRGLTQVAGFDVRKDLGTRFDAGVQGSVQYALTKHAVAFSGGPAVGFSPAGNLWISAGYNIAGYRDRDFEDDRYTRKGAFLTLRAKFDRASAGKLVGAK